MMTNAQAALMAAAMSSRLGGVDLAQAARLKTWLDEQDAADQRKPETERCVYALQDGSWAELEQCKLNAGHNGPHLTEGGKPWDAPWTTPYR